MSENKVIVIDNGSNSMKVGFGGEDGPREVVPTSIGVPKEGESKSEYFGSEHKSVESLSLEISHPIESGIIKDWDQMEKIWKHCLIGELKVDPEEYNVYLTESPTNPKANREKMTQIMFETFGVDGMYLTNQAVLSLYASGRTTGCVIDSGYGVTHAVPVYEGFTLPHAVMKNFIAGKAITDHFVNLLTAEGWRLAEQGGLWNHFVNTAKEKTAFVSLDFNADQCKAQSTDELKKNYELPDGKTITVNTHRFEAPEALFKPSLIGNDDGGMHELAFQSIEQSDVDLRKEFSKNIVLSGGTTLYEGLPDRLKKEVSALCPFSQSVNIVAPENRQYTTWIGGSILCSTAPDYRLITKDNYYEMGPEIVHQKCE